MNPADDARFVKVEEKVREWLSANGFVPRRIATPTSIAWTLMALGNGGRKEEEREEYGFSQARLQPYEVIASSTLRLTEGQASALNSVPDHMLYGLQLALLHIGVSFLVIQRPLSQVDLSTAVPVEALDCGGLAIALRKLGDAAAYLDIALRQATGVEISRKDTPVN